MSTISPPWRFLIAVFLAVTLVALSVAGAGHSHGGAAHVGHAFVYAVGHPEASGSGQVADLSDGADSADDKAAAGPCGLNCHHTSFVRWDFPVVAISWEPERTLAGIREVEFDSLALETPPEPPRTFA
ncbi:hypothetical protein [Methylorubrum extorquens]|jgi:hypothetical protein|uniref:DUF2946 domain-containing protein n=2 Tax=Methylorubrum extorquens TaxID=408 RepID=C7CEV4_METED|nr:hypothetical protein [Methylorubrum extorquens]EHP91189.1 hypothetical protein MetexDRAFT_3935 [Methylorubrum extorquens DSM 13060]MCG5248740.1 hypothetical protein [Methylorubrum extorquens]CAX22846.1 protein of unknown function; putative exported protein [Methylorubrum extorquens DM4]